MAFLDNNNKGEVKFYLTQKGIEQMFSQGVKSQIKYFAFSDEDVYYPSDVIPNKFFEISGCREETTAYSDYCKYKIQT